MSACELPPQFYISTESIPRGDTTFNINDSSLDDFSQQRLIRYQDYEERQGVDSLASREGDDSKAEVSKKNNEIMTSNGIKEIKRNGAES